MKSHVLVQTTHRQQPKSQHEQIYKRRFMKVPMLISLAAALLFTSRGFAAPYDDIAAKGYRWANTNGLVACLSKDDLREIIKHQTDETGLQMVEQLRAYWPDPSDWTGLNCSSASFGLVFSARVSWLFYQWKVDNKPNKPESRLIHNRPGPVRCENAWYRSVTSQQCAGPEKGDCG